MTPEDQARAIGRAVADRCQGERKPGQAPTRYAIIEQAATMGALEALSREEQVRAEDAWQDIATAPDDAPFMAGLWVENNQTGERWWETYIVSIDDETGEAQSWPEGEPLPWSFQDFDKWRPLPAPPSRASGHEGGGE